MFSNDFTQIFPPPKKFNDLNIVKPDSYNCKSKIYPDGSENSVIHSQQVFGGDPYSSSRRVLSDDSARRAFFLKHMKEEQNCQNILDVLNGVSSQDIIDNNNWLYSHGLLSAADCVNSNYNERLWVKNINNLDPFKTPVRRYLGDIRDDSLKRSKDRIFDYVCCNSWDWFFTGTINPQKMDSHKPSECVKPLKYWLNNMQKRYGISYICIFEYHKSGRIHMHGLLNEDKQRPLRLEYSKTRKYYGFKRPMRDRTAKKYGLNPENALPVYNLKSWRFGFTTCIPVYGDKQQLAYYVTKYLTKDIRRIFGRYFWHSRDLEKPKIVYSNVDFQSIPSAEFHGFKYMITKER